MTIKVEQIAGWMRDDEDEHLEFKEALNTYDFEKLVRYCVALANEGGGKFILGISNKRPRVAIGTGAFANLAKTQLDLLERLHLRIDACEVQCKGCRIVVFDIPSRPIGSPVHYKGAYWMRSGESLAPMPPDMLRRIFDEAGPDFSAEVCPDSELGDLDVSAIDLFRRQWHRKSGVERIREMPQEQLLTDAELIRDGGLTYAALILFGTRVALGRNLAQSEVVYEYRSQESSIPYSKRIDYREGFFLFYDKLWEAIDARNDVQQYQQGLFRYDVPMFDEQVVREAVLNAISHRDYRLGGSVFVRQWPNRLQVSSPGGLPPGVTAENILYKQSPRNRRIAETFARCGLVERSGQGVDLMFEQSIRQGKRLPDYKGTDDYEVSLTLYGEVQDPEFIRFLEKVGAEQSEAFTTEDLLVLDLVHRERRVPESLKSRVNELLELGVLERHGRGRGVRYLLSRRFYAETGKAGVYTRKRGLNRQTNKELLVQHLIEDAKDGSPLRILGQVLPEHTKKQVYSLLCELREEGRVRLEGQRKSGVWFACDSEAGAQSAPDGSIRPERDGLNLET